MWWNISQTTAKCYRFVKQIMHQLTIRLRARAFYEVIVDEGKARVNYHFIEIESK